MTKQTVGLLKTFKQQAMSNVDKKFLRTKDLNAISFRFPAQNKSSFPVYIPNLFGWLLVWM